MHDNYFEVVLMYFCLWTCNKVLYETVGGQFNENNPASASFSSCAQCCTDSVITCSATNTAASWARPRDRLGLSGLTSSDFSQKPRPTEITKKRKSIYTISPESSSPRHYLYSVLLGSNLRTDKSAPAACDFCCAPHTIKFSITHPHELHGYLVLTWPMIGTKALPKIGERAVTWNRRLIYQLWWCFRAFRFSFIVGMSTSG